MPTLHRNPSSQVVNLNEQLYMIDCAEGTQMQLRKFGIKFQRINHIFISHLHGDHFLGLVGLLSTLHLLGREREMHIYASKELENIVKTQLKASQSYLRFNLVFHYLKFDQEQLLFDSKSMSIRSFPLKHRIDCCGFKFEEKQREHNIIPEKIKAYNIPVKEIPNIKRGEDLVLPDGKVIKNGELVITAPSPRSYAYCSDTAYSEDVIASVKGCNLLYHEATFCNDLQSRAKETHHSTAGQAATVAIKAGVKQLVIGHYSARYKEVNDLLSEAKIIFPNTMASEDGITIEVPTTDEC